MVILVKEEAWVSVVADHSMSTICSKCIKPKDNCEQLDRCKSCQVVHYCSKACQEADLIDHKMECQFLQRRNAPGLSRLISRIAMRLQRGEFGKAYNGRTFKDLIDHSKDIVKARSKVYYLFLKVRRELSLYMTKEYLPNDKQILSIFSKVSCNFFQISQNDENVGIGLYLGLSVHDHACDAVAFVESDGTTRILRAMDGVEYSKELLICYLNSYELKDKRRKHLREEYFFECACAWCSDPQHEGWASSIRSTCCPDSACLLVEDAQTFACHNCGKADKMSVDEAKDINEMVSASVDELDADDDSMMKGLRDFDDSYFRNMTDLYDNYAKVLSPFNMRLAQFTQLLAKMASFSDRKGIATEYGTKHVIAYRNYLGPRHYELTSFLTHAANSIGLETFEAQELLSEANRISSRYYSDDENAKIDTVSQYPGNDSILKRLDFVVGSCLCLMFAVSFYWFRWV